MGVNINLRGFDESIDLIYQAILSHFFGLNTRIEQLGFKEHGAQCWEEINRDEDGAGFVDYVNA